MMKGYQDRKKFVRDTNRELAGKRKRRAPWPELAPGEYVYSVKNKVSRELIFVVARDRSEAEFKAFPGATSDILRSMPVHAGDTFLLAEPVKVEK